MGLGQFVTNAALALLWGLMHQSFSFATLLTGWVLGAAIIYGVSRATGMSFYLRRALAALELAIVFAVEVVKANIKVAYQVLHPGLPVEPGFLAVPLDVKTEGQITLLSLLITMTPGTLSVDVSPDRTHLIVHALDVSDPEGAKQAMKTTFERRIMEVMS